MRKKQAIRNLTNSLFFLLGLTFGIGVIWPGVFVGKSRECFFEIIRDGSDGDVSLNTILSISPNYLMQIKNAKNKYSKVLLIGDYCFRRF